ncbi:MAG: hypothetical protein ACC628_16245, partial [Pirellulaceae bacterium]
GYLLGDGWNLCPGAAGDDSTRRSHIPTPTELRAARGASLVQYQRTMGGSYGYTLHYVAYGRYHCVKVSDRPTYAIMADAPSHSRGGLRSANHGRCGQNVLYEDGHIQYLTQCAIDDCRDPIFLNDQGIIAAGSHRDDAVIGHSSARPLLPLAVSSR